MRTNTVTLSRGCCRHNDSAHETPALPCPVHLFYQLTSTKCRKVPSSNHSHFLIIRAGRKLFLYVVGLPPPPAPPPEFIPIWMHDLICIGALDAACLHYLELLGWLISGVLSMWWDDLWFAVGVLRWRRGERGGEGGRSAKLLANCNIACPAQHYCTQILGWPPETSLSCRYGGRPAISHTRIDRALLSFHDNPDPAFCHL